MSQTTPITPEPEIYRYRLTFTKGRPVKYVAYLDTVIAWTRAFRRAGIPLAYTQGFNPKARIQMASSLPLGYTSVAEIMDIYLKKEMSADEIVHAVNQTLPAGFHLVEGEPVERKSPTLQSKLTQADYQVIVETDTPGEVIKARIKTLLDQDQILRTRIRRQKEERFDLRPLLHQLALVSKVAQDAIFIMRLSAGQHGNLRPDDVLKALALADGWFEVERTKLIFSFDS